jgi:hypothetical protein
MGNLNEILGFEVLTAVTAKKKQNIFYDVTPRSSIEAHRRFGGAYRHNFGDYRRILD